MKGVKFQGEVAAVAVAVVVWRCLGTRATTSRTNDEPTLKPLSRTISRDLLGIGPVQGF